MMMMIIATFNLVNLVPFMVVVDFFLLLKKKMFPCEKNLHKQKIFDNYKLHLIIIMSLSGLDDDDNEIEYI